MTDDPTLGSLDRLVGHWITQATHPALPGVVVDGTVDVEWLEGDRFLIHRSRVDHADFPDSISIVGRTAWDRADALPEGSEADGAAGAAGSPLAMHYFDSRGVFRAYLVDADDATWRIWRDAPGFSQRFVGTFAGSDLIDGRWQLDEGDGWRDDVAITYRRAP